MKKLLAVFIILSQSIFAGGSASKSHILSLLTTDLSVFIENSYKLQYDGECVRVGRHLPNGGERVLPCSIVGEFKRTGETFKLSFSEDGQSYSEIEL